MKSIYIVSFLLGVSIWFNILSYMYYVDRKVAKAYDDGYERGVLETEREEDMRRKIEMIREKISQTPGK